MVYDVIVIGGGLGGLTAGARLAREGKKILLIEQHDRPGGCASTFTRGPFTLEVGLHEMDGPGSRDMKTRVFNELEVFGNVEFVKVPEFYRFLHGNSSFIMPHDPLAAAEGLMTLFPAQKDGINAFFDTILNRNKKNRDQEEKDLSLGDYLDSIISDEELKLVLLGNLGYFHDDPYSLSLAYYKIAQGSYFSNGASFIRGGSQKLSDHLASYIRNHGGEVVLNHTVRRLLYDGNRISSVIFSSAKNKGEENEAAATNFIANCALPNLPGMLGDEAGSDLESEFREYRNGASLLSVYFGFNKSLKELGNKHYSTFVFDDSIHSQKDIPGNNKADFNKRSYTFVDYGQVDSGLAEEGKSVGALCCIDYADQWIQLERKEYLKRKKIAEETFINRLEKMFPGFAGAISYIDSGTPLTVKRYTGNPGGSVYGFARTPSQVPYDQVKRFSNLFVASAWGKTGGGFSGAILGGYLCATNILRKSRT